MNQSLRTTLLVASALLTILGAVVYATIVVPDLHGDLIEIGVRQSVLGGTVVHLYFAGLAMFGFAVMVTAAAIQSIRGTVPARLPLVAIAAIYLGYGVIAFTHSHSVHHLGAVLIAVLLGAALMLPSSQDCGASGDV